MSARPRGRPLALLLVAAAVTAALVAHGLDYYRLDAVGRVDHEAHHSLRSSGAVGHLYGIVGTALMLANLLYLARKHSRLLRGRGSLRGWMQVHVFAGLLGTILIVLHSAFQARNHVAQAAAWSLGVLVLTGLLGRYMYALVPRGEAGEEESEEAVRARVAALRRELAVRLQPEQRAVVWPLADTPVAEGGPVKALLRLPLLPLDRLRERRRIRDARAALASTGGDLVLDLATQLLEDSGRLRALARVRDLFVWWRALHRAFAIVMVLAMLVHVGVALYYGYTWFGD